MLVKEAMNIKQRLTLIEKIYLITDAYGVNKGTVCHRGCAACCTCNVTATTLEAMLIHERLGRGNRTNWLRTRIESVPPKRFQPKLTINQMVRLCAQGKSIPEEANDPAAGMCPLLEDNQCSIYAVRPFGCRAMLSISDCSESGEAHMPPLALSVNNVIMQYLEALDQPGATGNLIDLLRFFEGAANRQSYLQNSPLSLSEGLLANRSFPVLMVPPEHREAVKPLVQSLNEAIRAIH